ncbi:MAG: metallophosphoesterase family protein [Phycisphaerae bacterium]|nr:metallophosphoesterase family protein [Phycisphaerae bacterium]
MKIKTRNLTIKQIFKILIILFIVLCITGPTFAKQKDKISRGGHRNNKNSEVILPAEAEKTSKLSLVLGRPTDKSVVVSILSAEEFDGYIEYGTSSGNYTNKTDAVIISAGKPTEIILNKLQPNTQYFYRLKNSAKAEPEYSFHTQRAVGSTFIFDIQGDSHPERPRQNDPELYRRTLLSAATDKPDFYMTIGDDFSVDTLRAVNAETVAQCYILQRPFLGLVGHSAPLFLVNGNHEQAAACNLDGTANNVAVWAQNARNSYYPQPGPDSFYTGDTKPVKFIGPLRDYYAWTWGDALFVVIDPYWHSQQPVDNVFGGGDKRRDMWAITIGDVQYQWLKKTLEQSKSKYKFVFAHHVLGTGRGGIEGAGLYEWGGKNRRGEWEFDQKRPGWSLPIHQLMAKNGVTIFFQGHDHIFVRQELDGVIYQTLADPANPNYTADNQDKYQSGVKLPGSGYLRVTVSPQQVKVDYIRAYLAADETAEHKNGEIAYSYTITR